MFWCTSPPDHKMLVRGTGALTSRVPGHQVQHGPAAAQLQSWCHLCLVVWGVRKSMTKLTEYGCLAPCRQRPLLSCNLPGFLVHRAQTSIQPFSAEQPCPIPPTWQTYPLPPEQRACHAGPHMGAPVWHPRQARARYWSSPEHLAPLQLGGAQARGGSPASPPLKEAKGAGRGRLLGCGVPAHHKQHAPLFFFVGRGAKGDPVHLQWTANPPRASLCHARSGGPS